MANSYRTKTVTLPKRILGDIIEAHRKWENVSNELEDFLLSSNKPFLKKMRKAKKEHRAGILRDLEELM